MKNINYNKLFFQQHENANIEITKILPIIGKITLLSFGTAIFSGLIAYPAISNDLQIAPQNLPLEMTAICGSMAGLLTLMVSAYTFFFRKNQMKVKSKAISELDNFADILKDEGIETTGEMLKDGEIIVNKSHEDTDIVTSSSELITEKILAFKNIRNEINLLREISNRDSENNWTANLQVFEKEEAAYYLKENNLNEYVLKKNA